MVDFFFFFFVILKKKTRGMQVQTTSSWTALFSFWVCLFHLYISGGVSGNSITSNFLISHGVHSFVLLNEFWIHVHPECSRTVNKVRDVLKNKNKKASNYQSCIIYAPTKIWFYGYSIPRKWCTFGYLKKKLCLE